MKKLTITKKQAKSVFYNWVTDWTLSNGNYCEFPTKKKEREELAKSQSDYFLHELEKLHNKDSECASTL